MGLRQKEFSMLALGRSTFLGQMYDATSEQLLNQQLFSDADLQKTTETQGGFTFTSYKDVLTQSDRAKALDISAELSVSVMGGMVSLSGSGSYLDTEKSNVTSHEVSMICVARKNTKRLNLKRCVSMEDFENAKSIGATHVVTAILYGGQLIANFVDRDSSSGAEKKISGKFTASVLEGMSAQFSAKGSASVESKDAMGNLSKSHEFTVYGDYSADKSPTPTTVEGVFELVKKWGEVVGSGVPMEVTLTPISQFVDGSLAARMLHELEKDQLQSVCEVFDELFSLRGRRAKLVAMLNAELGAFCPTFLKACRERKTAVDKSLSRARSALAKFLVEFRAGGTVSGFKDIDEFLDNIKKGCDADTKACKGDESTLELLDSIHTLTSQYQAPLTSLKDIRNDMTKVAQGSVGVVIIPSSPNFSSAVNTFDVLVKSIRAWRAEEDKKDTAQGGATPQTRFISFYADPDFHSEFLKLGGRKGALNKGLEGAQKDGIARFVHYGLIPNMLVKKEYEWSLLNEDGWAFLTNESESYYYVGQVKGGKRHGRGIVTYANGSTYTGDWWEDERHGGGELVEGTTRITGVFMNNQHRPDGVLLDLTIYANHVPVALYKVPLGKYDTTSSHVLRIGTMLRWKDKDVYRLSVESKSKQFEAMKMDVLGNMLKPGQNNKLHTATWPIDKGPVELKAVLL